MSKYTVYSTYKLLFVHDMNVAFYLKDGYFCHEVISDAKNKKKDWVKHLTSIALQLQLCTGMLLGAQFSI